MRTISLKSASDFDKWFRGLSKSLLGLFDNASTHFLYSPRSSGGAGMPVFHDEALFASIEGAFKLLTSKDLTVRRLASDDLKHTVSIRFPSHKFSLSLVEDYLNSSISPNSLGRKSIWSGARHASKALNICWAIRQVEGCLLPTLFTDADNTSPITLSVPPKGFVFSGSSADSSKIFTWSCGKKQPYQGRAAHALARAGNCSGPFLRTGHHLRYTDYYWVHKARLNLTRGLRAGRAFVSNIEEKGCRFGCTKSNSEVVYPETQAHVVNHCKRSLPAINARHNHIVRLLKSAARANKWHVLAEDEAILDDSHRSDLVLRSGSARSVLIGDVTIPLKVAKGL